MVKKTASCGFFYLLKSHRSSTCGKHQHPEIKVVNTSTSESDGSDATNKSLPGFPKGLFVAMLDDCTFQFYDWENF
jgi:3-phytase